MFSWLSIVTANSVFHILNIHDPYKFSLEEKTSFIYEDGQDVTGAFKIKGEVDTCRSKETCGEPCIFIENMLIALDVLNAFIVKEGLWFHTQLHKRHLTHCNDDGLVTCLNLPISASDFLVFCVLKQLQKHQKTG